MFYYEESIVDTEGNFLLQSQICNAPDLSMISFLGQTNATTCTNLTINSHQNKLDSNGETKALVTSLWRTRWGIRKIQPLTFLALLNLNLTWLYKRDDDLTKYGLTDWGGLFSNKILFIFCWFFLQRQVLLTSLGK